MEYRRLGKTDLTVSRTGFGALPIQRISMDCAVKLLQRAEDNGINFFDTARYYSDSEAKIGTAFRDRRTRVVIATKAMANTRDEVIAGCETSLKMLQTDYIDLFQLHNPPQLPERGDPESAWEGLEVLRQRGLVRYVGITNHKLDVARKALSMGCFDSIQFPFSTLSSNDELSLIDECTTHECGCIAMKAMAGGLISSAASAFAYLRQYRNLIPIWGIQHEWELDEFLAFESAPPELDDTILAIIEKDRMELAGRFCRGCGYCMPCPQGIVINWVARMSLLLRRAPSEGFMTDEWKAEMENVRNCTECGACLRKCPYHHDVPGLLKENLLDYEEFVTNSGAG